MILGRYAGGLGQRSSKNIDKSEHTLKDIFKGFQAPAEQDSKSSIGNNL